MKRKMASYEGFDDFDTDDEILKDVVALPLQSENQEFLKLPLNSVPVVLDKPEEKTEVIHGQKQIDAVKEFKDVSFSSDNYLTDPCRGHQCSVIQEAWISGMLWFKITN